MKIDIIKALCIGVLIDSLLLAIVGITMGLKEVFVVLLVIFLGHLACSIGLILYRSGDLKESDFGFIRSGILFVLWRLWNICG